MNYLDPGDLFRIAEAAIGSPPTVRNPGLMGSAATRPQAVVNGRESYLTVHRKADRKSTRLNSSHANISYAVFCLKKKTISKKKANPGAARHLENHAYNNHSAPCRSSAT